MQNNSDQIITISSYGVTVITNMTEVEFIGYEEDFENFAEENFNNILNNNNE